MTSSGGVPPNNSGLSSVLNCVATSLLLQFRRPSLLGFVNVQMSNIHRLHVVLLRSFSSVHSPVDIHLPVVMHLFLPSSLDQTRIELFSTGVVAVNVLSSSVICFSTPLHINAHSSTRTCIDESIPTSFESGESGALLRSLTSLRGSRRSAPSGVTLTLDSILLRHRPDCACGLLPSSIAVPSGHPYMASLSCLVILSLETRSPSNGMGGSGTRSICESTWHPDNAVDNFCVNGPSAPVDGLRETATICQACQRSS